MPATSNPHAGSDVDCDAGRALGCQTFCCRLIVRLAPGDTVGGRTAQGTLAKDPRDGWCVHLDRETKRCRIWATRPTVCRRYDCNHDPLLQLVLRDSYSDLVPFQLRAPAPTHAERVVVPHHDQRPGQEP